MEENKVQYQPKNKRVRSFDEVSLGYSKKIAFEEAKRCPQCADPVCIRGCPLGIDVRGFIRFLREGNISGAYDIIKKENGWPAICGRVCNAPCEVACVLKDENAPISIRALERFTADYGSKPFVKKDIVLNGKNIAIIGSGPSGLTAARELALKGYTVKIFEAHDLAGGMLRYGIPEFRLPAKILDQEIRELTNLGVEIKTLSPLTISFTLSDLINEGMSAVLLALGAGTPKWLDIPGANIAGVYYSPEFLLRFNHLKDYGTESKDPNFILGKRVVVLGKDHSAFDCARIAIRRGSDVTVLFPQAQDDIEITPEELLLTKEEGVKLEALLQPLTIKADDSGFVRSVKAQRLDFSDSKNKGHWELVSSEEDPVDFEADTVIISMGNRGNSTVQNIDGILINKDNSINVDRNGMTSIPNVFACGNIVTPAGTVVDAMAAGKKAAQQIDEFLK